MKRVLRSYLAQLKEGIFSANPVFVQMLGMCPVLATTTSVSNAIGMGLAATAVLIFSNFFISILRKWIPSEVRIAAYIVIIAGFVTAVQLLIAAYLPALDASLGVFIPLIVVNCIILARAEAFASKNKPFPAIVDGLGMGLGFTLALILIASVREVLGAGTFLGHPVFGADFPPVLLFGMPCGAFITVGLLMALVQWIRARAEAWSSHRKKDEAPTPDATTGGAE